MTKKEEAQIIDQARRDRESGDYKVYEPTLGDRLTDAVWSPVILAAGDKFSGQLCEEKQDLYHKYRTLP